MRLKKIGFFGLLAIVGVGVTASYLIPLNCSHDSAEEKPPEKKEMRTPPKEKKPNLPTCTGDDCPSPENDTDPVEAEADDAGVPDAAPACETFLDCSCGYHCVSNQCRKLESGCCADTDCGAGLTCVKKEAMLSSDTGTCMLSQCDEDKQCDGRCGTHCVQHRCEKTNCCADSDCPAGKYCALSGYNSGAFQYDDGRIESSCKTPECNSNADCNCNQSCTEHTCAHSYYSEAPMKCCGTDVSDHADNEVGQYWTCVPHENIENGRCIEDAHCPKGQVCYRGERCLPASCTENSDCGCYKVCRKGHCEFGCDKNSDCCSEGDTCDRGWCFDSSGNIINMY